jgi:molybdate transport system substrate-binding protein
LGKLATLTVAVVLLVDVGLHADEVRVMTSGAFALLQAESIAYSAQASGVYLETDLFPLSIADQLRGKSRRIERERVGAVVARGEAEIGFQQISELLPIAGNLKPPRPSSDSSSHQKGRA